VLVLLNGPKIGELHTGEEVLFGGIEALNEPGIFQVANSPLRVRGFIKLEGGVLEELVSLGALEVVEGVDFQDLIDTPAEERWQEAGGRIKTLGELATARLGDTQRLKWYSRFLGLRLKQ